MGRRNRAFGAGVVMSEIQPAEARDNLSIRDFTSEFFDTSVWTNSASPPALVISATVSLPPDSLRSAATTFAPARANANALARPIPEEAPVTRATRSWKSKVISPAFCWNRSMRSRHRIYYQTIGLTCCKSKYTGTLMNLHWRSKPYAPQIDSWGMARPLGSLDGKTVDLVDVHVVVDERR